MVSSCAPSVPGTPRNLSHRAPKAYLLDNRWLPELDHLENGGRRLKVKCLQRIGTRVGLPSAPSTTRSLGGRGQSSACDLMIIISAPWPRGIAPRCHPKASCGLMTHALNS